MAPTSPPASRRRFAPAPAARHPRGAIVGELTGIIDKVQATCFDFRVWLAGDSPGGVGQGSAVVFDEPGNARVLRSHCLERTEKPQKQRAGKKERTPRGHCFPTGETARFA